MISGTYNNPTRERFLQAQRERITREHRYEQAEVQEIRPMFEVVGALAFDADTDTLEAA